MDWGIIAEATFFTALAFLAIVIAVFVLSTSVLGTAIESEKQEKKQKQEDLKRETLEEKKRIEEMLSETMNSNAKVIKNARSNLKKLQRKIATYEKEYNRIERRYKNAFTVRGAVVIPGISFLLAIIFSCISWSLLGQYSTFHIPGFEKTHFYLADLLVLAWAFCLFGIYRIVNSLAVIIEVRKFRNRQF